MTTTRKEAFLAELVAQIRNEDNPFDMSVFVTYRQLSDREFFDANVIPSCGTAGCIAGHLQALRPELARASGHPGSHDRRAAAVYEAETGEPCRLDFFGDRLPTDEDGEWRRLTSVTREEAIAHILGTSENWPQLNDDDLVDDFDF